MKKLLTRDQFREGVFRRDRHECYFYSPTTCALVRGVNRDDGVHKSLDFFEDKQVVVTRINSTL